MQRLQLLVGFLLEGAIGSLDVARDPRELLVDVLQNVNQPIPAVQTEVDFAHLFRYPGGQSVDLTIDLQ